MLLEPPEREPVAPGEETVAGRPEFDERITSAHTVWQREDPEIIAEVANVHHEQVGGSLATSNLAYYVQAAYRLPSAARLWKPSL